jgi:predicted dienelactone hydrolase
VCSSDLGGGAPRGIFNSLRKGNEGLIAGRVADVKLILDHLSDLDALDAGLAARIDRNRIAVTGHSFGAFTAQQMAGAETVNPKTGERVGGRDARVRAVVAISPPGEMFKIINAQSWLKVDVPMLVTTGTWDINAHFWPDWRAHTLSYQTAKPGLNWLLVVQGADHYLGHLICRPERKEPAQTDALRMVNASAVTFLDAFVKGDASAHAWLDAHPLQDVTGGFASLDHR